MPVTPELVRKWKYRGRLVSRGHDTPGSPLYRVGDVVDLLDTRTADSAS